MIIFTQANKKKFQQQQQQQQQQLQQHDVEKQAEQLIQQQHIQVEEVRHDILFVQWGGIFCVEHYNKDFKTCIYLAHTMEIGYKAIALVISTPHSNMAE